MSEALRYALLLQLLVTVFLALVFWFLYARFQRLSFFRYWTWAWFAFAVFLAAGALLSAPHELLWLTWHSAVSAAAGFLQILFLLLGVRAFQDPARVERRHVLVGSLLAVALAEMSFAAAFFLPEPASRYVVQAVPRQVGLALVYGYCVWVFRKYWRRTQSRAALATGGACLLLGTDQLLYAVGAVDSWLAMRHLLSWPPPPSSALYLHWAVDVSGELGIAFGMVLLFLDEHRRIEAELFQSQRLQALGTLSAGIAHDFNNLLTIIRGYSDLLQERGAGSAADARAIREIRQATDRAAALIRQLLAFSRKQVLRPSLLDLNRVLRDLEPMLRRLIGEDIEMVLLTAPGLASVQADPAQIEQVVVNLVVNARDAMPGGGKLTLLTANVEGETLPPPETGRAAAGSYVLLAVSDTGAGMDARTQARIFEPFFTTKEVGKGTGLGLAMVYGIVKQSEGYIRVASEPGEGTSIQIYLPGVSQAAERQPHPGSEQPASGGSETILLVEDEDQLRSLVHDILSGRGYTILTGATVGEAEELCRRHAGPIHLLLTDVVMPGSSGPELARRVAARHPGIKILYMSGYSGDAIDQHGGLQPGACFLEKPFTSAALIRKVREVLGQTAARNS